MEPLKVDLETAKLPNQALKREICRRLGLHPDLAGRQKERDFLLCVTQRLADQKVDEKLEKAP